jgi:hypothetical protein
MMKISLTVRRIALLALLVSALLTTGCAVSRTWQEVTDARLEGKWQSGRSFEYAWRLRKLLMREHVESRLVVYQRRVRGFYGGGQKVTHVAVIYRDPEPSPYPWWFMDNESNVPRWLPNGTVAEQVRFSDPRLIRVVKVSTSRSTEVKPLAKHVARDDSEETFRRRHGGKFNSASESDQRKMREIKSWDWTRTAVL